MNEFARPRAVATIGRDVKLAIVAEPSEREALARRFDVLAIDRLEAELVLNGDGVSVNATARVRADVTQRCVITALPVPTRIDQPFAIRFVPASAMPHADEVELSAEDCDTIDYVGESIDFGEAVAETLALALDAFPRAPGADAALKAAGVLREGEEAVGPFAALAALRKGAT